METKHEIKKKRKYVIAVISSPIMYLYKRPGVYEYCFYKNIEKATKTIDRFDAEILLKEYYQVTQDHKLEMVIIPLDVTYELIEE